MLGWPEILILASITIILFSARRLPELGRALGETFGQFKKSNSLKDVTPPNNKSDSK